MKSLVYNGGIFGTILVIFFCLHSGWSFGKDYVMTLAANGLIVGDEVRDGFSSSFSLSIESAITDKPSYLLNSQHWQVKSFSPNPKAPTLSGVNCEHWEGITSHSDCNTSILTFSSTAEMPLQTGFSLFGRLGLKYFQKDNAGNIDLLRLNLNDIGATFGFGLKFELKKDWFLKAESEGFADQRLDFMGIGSSLILSEPKHSIGLSVRF